METERTTVNGIVQFSFYYKLLDAEVRPCPYAKADYQPATLSFTLSATTYDGTAPSYDDLKAGDATLRGYKLKKDRSVGLAEARENFYYGDYPVWIDQIIEAAARELREGA